MTRRSISRRLLVVPVVGAALVSGGCVTTPTAPAVRVMPGYQKSFAQFQADDAGCRQYAYSSVGGPESGQAAANAAAGNAVIGSALGAAAGAIIGAATGQAGAGAAIGAGTGLLFGSAATANASGYSQYELQRNYDTAYLQCMYAHGNQVPGRVAYRSYAPSYPPPNTPAPAAGPSNYPPPNYPPPANYPPPNTPPPV